MKKKVSIFLSIILVVCLVGVLPVEAKNKRTRLSDKKVQLNIGKTKTIKLNRATKKVKWKVANKKVVKIVKKSGQQKNKIKIKGLKAGKTKITAVCAGKKYVVNVTVKKKSSKSKNNTQKTIPETTKVEVTTVAETSTTKEVETTAKNEETTTEAETTNKETETTTEVESESTTTQNETPTTGVLNPYENTNIVATVEKSVITIEEELVINFTMQDYKEGQAMCWGYAPVKFEKYVDGEWVSIPSIQGFPEPMYATPGYEAQLKIQLNTYFDVSEGHYRWTHEVNWTEVSVEFDIVG